MSWQVQEAKQRFSKLLGSATTEGPQVVTRHGEEIAVAVDIAEYRRLNGEVLDFKDFLRTGPEPDDVDITRDKALPREIDWEV